jgi:hypothetical protein
MGIGLWFYDNYHLKLNNWKPLFDLLKVKSNVASILVKMLILPIMLCIGEVFVWVGNASEKFITIDGKKGIYCSDAIVEKVCVEINLEEGLPDYIDILVNGQSTRKFLTILRSLLDAVSTGPMPM